MKKTIEQIVKFFIYASFFVPLVVLPSSFIFPFIVPKILLFRSLVVAMLGGYIALLLLNWEEYKPRPTLLNYALLAFLFSFAISTFVGMDAYHSFWDNHERMLGLFTIFHYVAYYFVCSSVFKNWTEWRTALIIFLLAGSIAMFIGMLQRGNPDLLLNQGSDRVASTLGNAIYVGGYGLFLFFAGLLVAVKEKNTVWKIIEGILALLGLTGLFLSRTRGSILGLLVGLSLVIVAYVFILKNQPKVRLALGGFLVVALACFGFLFANRQQEWVKNLPGFGRLLGTTLSGDTGGTRLIAWNIALESWKERPFFGWGPNNFFYAFNQYYNPRSLEFGYSETWFDNAHNIILNTLTVQGAFGLVVYLSIFGVAFWSIISAYRQGRLDKHLTIISASFLAAHLVQNITVFENPTSYLYFMFWLALTNHFTQPSVQPSAVSEMGKSVAGASSTDKTLGYGAFGIISVGVLALIFIFNIQPARANSKTLAALFALERDPITGVAAAREALGFNSPHIDDIRSDLSRTLVEIVGSAYSKLGRDRANELLSLAEEELQKDVVLHPRDIRLYMMLTQIAQLQYVVNNDARYLTNAERYVTTGLGFSPKRQQFMYMAATIKAQIGKRDEAIALTRQSIDEDPKVSEGYWRLAYLYQIFGDNTKAREVIAEAKARGIVFDGQGKQVEDLVMATSSKATGTKK